MKNLLILLCFATLVYQNQKITRSGFHLHAGQTVHINGIVWKVVKCADTK